MITLLIIIVLIVVLIKYYNLNKEYEIIKNWNNRMFSLQIVNDKPKLNFNKYEVKDLHIKYNKDFPDSDYIHESFMVDKLKRELWEKCAGELYDCMEVTTDRNYIECKVYMLKRR